MSTLLEANDKGRSQGKQFELALPQGKLWFELSASRMPTGLGQEPHFICLSRDITERKEAEHELTRLGVFSTSRRTKFSALAGGERELLRSTSEE